MDLASAVDHFLKDPTFGPNVTTARRIADQAARFTDYPTDLTPALVSALRRRGYESLYTHQARALATVRAGRSAVVVTPTASGKTLCYNLPVLDAILKAPETKALYLFPTKALAQDQTAELNELCALIEPRVQVFTYDGDTPTSVRQSVRTRGQIVVSNPDMLHTGILPNHPKWAKLFENLRYIVIDEIHAYRGVFGSHVANVLARLTRVCEFYHSHPVFIMSSATIANPAELARQLTGAAVELIDDSGAPRAEKLVLLYNPPLVDPGQGIRRGVVLEAERVARHFIREEIQTIVFTRSRLGTELITSYLHRSLPHLARRISGYRGGYLPSERRTIEHGLRDRSLLGVASTNALELGVDIGALDVSVIAGYPGSVASFWQQAGRAGRRSGLSLAVFVASNSPLDQFLVSHPEYFFGQPPEAGLVNPGNVFILLDQLKCAAFELPFTPGETFAGEPVGDVMRYFEEQGLVHPAADKYRWVAESYPAENVSLRSADAGNFVIVDRTGGRGEVIGELDRASAPVRLHEGAIYLHLGDQYEVKQLDYEGRKAYVEQARVDYYTQAITRTDIKVLTVREEQPLAAGLRFFTDVLVRTLPTGYKKLRFGTHENVGSGDIHLPEEEMHTHCCMLTFDDQLFARITPPEKQMVLLALGNLLRNILPVHLLCDPTDLGTAEQVRATFNDRPAIFVYDQYPGGIGLAQRLFEIAPAILRQAEDLVAHCPCPGGCPSCVGPESEAGPDVKRHVLRCLHSVNSVSSNVSA